MNKINILPDNIANKIAAGEVVQRPESVLKELLENALDAQAKSVEVFIKNAGKSIIQVVDDGVGMTEDDAKKCIERHATSKIKTIEDLERIQTFGFRGEALSAIASVSKIEIRTEMADEELGAMLKFDDEGLQFEIGSYAKGTSVAVKSLFYNTPGRRNFLKSNSTELKHLIESFKRTALSYPKVAFKFWNDDDLIFDFSASDIKERMQAVFADNILDAVVEVDEKTELINIYGFTAKPTFLKRSKGEQYVYINNRYISSRVINHAVFSSYENLLDKGDYPFFVLFLELDHAKVDVNVHPSKLEVKFDDEKDIYRLVNAVIKRSIGKYDLVPRVGFSESDESESKIIYAFPSPNDKNDFSDRPIARKDSREGAASHNKGIFSEEEIDVLFSSLHKDIRVSKDIESTHPFNQPHTKEIEHEVSAESKSAIKPGEVSSFIVSLHNKYILSQIKSGLMIIDQHVAHERILYEKALNSFTSNIPFSQQLLFAQSIQVDPADYDLIKEIEEYLNKLGFELRFTGKRKIMITGVPSDVKIGSEVDTLIELLKEYRINEEEKNLEVRDNLAKSFSCKTAIKAGDKLTEQEMRQLVDQLFATSMPYVCPHGRPIIIKISLNEFDKRFGRT
ncbi:MAG: DNA mismatch repair endonuclease MutL [Bacteroidetes bacterium]|nr:DNA mismatch repair endonuclease MutL [Bacteroidota bacterium]MBU1678892.1 DNA mismatch repair endonuclease MutL [Bacteroidota bacterium]MBU2506002.1 DNA mismatch repair endonuclease MutL [Bacteroidota bacterium]